MTPILMKKIIPYWFIRDIYEGGYTKNLEINFDHHQNLPC